MEDYIPIAPTLITFSGEGSGLPSLAIRVRENGISEQTETFQVHLRLPFQQQGVVLENATATVFIIDNDGTCSSTPKKYYVYGHHNTLFSGVCVHALLVQYFTPLQMSL